MTYDQALTDRDYLFDNYGPAYDMTGAFGEGEELEKLIKRPTKACARDILVCMICHWFEAGYTPDGDLLSDGWVAPDMTDPNLQEIADRHCPSMIRQ